MTKIQLPTATPSTDDQPLLPIGDPNQLPVGIPFTADPNTWYYLKITFQNDKGQTVTGRAYKIGGNASTSFWDYMGVSTSEAGGAKFKIHANENGWDDWEIDDGNYLSVKATGWVYRSSDYKLGWKIVDGKLYNTYWSGPAGCQEHYFLVSAAYYIGQGLSPAFTCELVPV